MRGSWKIATIRGIDVYAHWGFAALLALITLAHGLAGRGLTGALEGLVFMLVLFACVVAHELGHALAARRYGIGTRDITLLPIGGVARLEKMPSEPRHELVIALAGPAVNVVIAAGLFAWLAVTATFEPLASLGLTRGPLAERLMAANLFLVVFNLLPAFPMDGGRVLQALLALRTSYVTATRVAARLGRGMAVLFAVVGLFENPLLLLIALFVWFAAGAEQGRVETSAGLAGVGVGRAMVTDFRGLGPGDSLESAARSMLAGSQVSFPVLEQGRLVGLLTRADLLRGLAESGPAATVARVMQKEVPTVEWSSSLELAFERLHEGDGGAVVVTSQGRTLGLVTAESISEYLLLRNALEGGELDRAA